MDLITLEELKRKLDAGESIDEIVKKYSVSFYPSGIPVPDFISVEQLIEIIEKAPELFTMDNDIPAWLFLLLLAREKFNILDSIVEQVYKGGKCSILTPSKKEDISNKTVCKTISTIRQQVTKEHISMLLSILEKRKGLLWDYTKDYIARLIMIEFLRPVKNYLDKEHFFPLFDWVAKESNYNIFKYTYVYSDFFEESSTNNHLMQERLIDCFISADASLIIDPNPSEVPLFMQKEKLALLNTKFFISSVAKSYSELSISKRVYLLNFPYFIENYPHLAIKSLKVLMGKPKYRSKFIIEGNKIFIPDKIWDILIKKDLLFLTKLIKNFPANNFSFNVDYVSDITKIACFINPEDSKKIQTRLKILKEVFSDDPTYIIINKIKDKVSKISLHKEHQQKAEIIKFAMDKVPFNLAFWFLRSLIPYSTPYDKYSEDKFEDEFGSVKEQLKEFLTFLEKEQ